MKHDELAVDGVRNARQSMVVGLTLDQLALADLGKRTAEPVPGDCEASVSCCYSRGHHQAGLDDAAHTNLAARETSDRLVFQGAEVRLDAGATTPVTLASGGGSVDVALVERHIGRQVKGLVARGAHRVRENDLRVCVDGQDARTRPCPSVFPSSPAGARLHYWH